jgi:arginine deiminase
MNQNINVTSEIGRLKKVMLHRPGREVENLVPEYLGRLLFDDIPYMKVAREEHDGFAQVLKNNGVAWSGCMSVLRVAVTLTEFQLPCPNRAAGIRNSGTNGP